MEMLQGVWKQHLRPRAVVGYGVKIFLPSPPNYVTRSPGNDHGIFTLEELDDFAIVVMPAYMSLFHLTIRSLNRHFQDLCELVEAVHSVFDFLASSETWVSPQDDITHFRP